MKKVNCVFCGIVEGISDAHVVWEDREHVAFLDINPMARGHVLLVPRAHVPWIDDMRPQAYAKLFERVRTLTPSIAKAAGAPRTGIIVEGYGVPHVHVHLVPIWKRGDLDPTRHAPTSNDELLTAAQRLIAVLENTPDA